MLLSTAIAVSATAVDEAAVVAVAKGVNEMQLQLVQKVQWWLWVLRPQRCPAIAPGTCTHHPGSAMSLELCWTRAQSLSPNEPGDLEVSLLVQAPHRLKQEVAVHKLTMQVEYSYLTVSNQTQTLNS